MNKFDPKKNYNSTLKDIGFITLNKATKKDYHRIGFKSGLEVHQQLKTKSKLFCRCPAGIYHQHDQFDAEVIRHMRPTLSELGEYDGTALMEFKTRKEIIYRLNNQNACTYEVDDTPPFPIDREALEIALEISQLSKLNIVGEVHITRKQYLDGSIPTGFQRTAILGVEGEIQLSNKRVRLIQLSIEEDSCREISDIGHTRIYKTDRLGMPLIETVTYPDMETPWELEEAAEYIRFLNRSTGKVRTGIGAGREDVNVSCEGGSRVEIKGVAHNSWIPALSHIEAFRQYALLNIRKLLIAGRNNGKNIQPECKEILPTDSALLFDPLKRALDSGLRVYVVNFSNCKGILSHFTQPGKVFGDEFSDRLKVVACIEKPNMIHSEELIPSLKPAQWEKIGGFLGSDKNDAQIVFWGPSDDIATAIETIEERFLMAYEGVPNETRKALTNGTTIFERVLPGSDRMYPDTDSAPIPLTDEYITKLGKDLPVDIFERYKQMKLWGIPNDAHRYLLSRNLIPLIEEISDKTGFDQKFIGTFLAHTYKNIEGKRRAHKMFSLNSITSLFVFLKEKGLTNDIASQMLKILYDHPKMRYDSILTTINFKKLEFDEILIDIPFLYGKFREEQVSKTETSAVNWLMGQVRKKAVGNVSLELLKTRIEEIILNSNLK